MITLTIKDTTTQSMRNKHIVFVDCDGMEGAVYNNQLVLYVDCKEYYKPSKYTKGEAERWVNDFYASE